MLEKRVRCEAAVPSVHCTSRSIPRSGAVLAVFIPELKSVINIPHGKVDIWVEMFLPKNASRKIGRFVFNKYSFIAMGLRPRNAPLQEGFPDSLSPDIWSCIGRFNLSSICVLKQETFSLDG
jgi:hypothetical protein